MVRDEEVAGSNPVTPTSETERERNESFSPFCVERGKGRRRVAEYPEEEYTAMISDLRRWHEISGKPVVIADIGNWVPTDMNPHRTSDMQTHAERGEDYAQGLARVMAEPWIIGWHWCGYIENLGRGWGIKDPYDEFYSDLTDRIREANAASQVAIGTRME